MSVNVLVVEDDAAVRRGVIEWSPESGARSPQAPLGRERELALASGLPPESLRLAEERLATIVSRIDLPELARSVREQAPAAVLSERRVVNQTTCLAPDELVEGPGAPGLVEDAGGASVGPLVPRWFGDDGLLFARDVRAGSRSAVQVVVADWPALSRLLLEEGARDVVGARLVRGASGHGVALATLPAVLRADPPAPPVTAWTPHETRMSLAWLAGLVSLGAVGGALRTSIAHAERRARFAAAVSHELRTPLTTLRLYSGLLADGVITDPAIRQEYLETIQAQSARLASLVENVLLHARIEHASGSRRRRMTVGQLVESIAPGAGLGLALSRSLARDLRGELSLVPSERGACFRLSLRLA